MIERNLIFQFAETVRSDQISVSQDKQPDAIFPCFFYKENQWLISSMSSVLDSKIRLFLCLDFLKTAAKVPSL